MIINCIEWVANDPLPIPDSRFSVTGCAGSEVDPTGSVAGNDASVVDIEGSVMGKAGRGVDSSASVARVKGSGSDIGAGVVKFILKHWWKIKIYTIKMNITQIFYWMT